MSFRHQIPSVMISSMIHAIVLAVLWHIVVSGPSEEEEFQLETVIQEEERPIEEVVQELDSQTEVAKTMNMMAGSVTNAVGGNNSPLAKMQKMEIKDLVQEPDVRVNTSQDMPGDSEIVTDLGEGEVTGEVGAIVSGYGPALDRLVRELIRMLRKDKLLVVWMFDESESMKDDQQQIKGRLKRVYEELKLVEKDKKSGGQGKKLRDVLLTMITSYGGQFHDNYLPRPESDPQKLMAAIDKIPVDKSGDENMCASLLAAIRKYRVMAARGDRKLVVVMVSDESGDDGLLVEDAIREAKIAKSPIYILGRESVFGSLYAHVRWRQPETGYIFYLPIRRGPETPFAEQMQYDGFRRRHDSQMSGFGPYEQVRLCRNSGGIFFQLPGEQQDLHDLDDRKNNMLLMREYLPDLSSRRDYAQERNSSKFRKAIWDVIVMLNPYHPQAKKFLELPDPETTRERFNTNPNQYGPQVAARIQQIVSIIGLMGQAQQHLERVRELREKEPSPRWRANFDLMVAQLYWYRLRLFQYAIGLDQFAKKDLPERLSKQKGPKIHNRWFIMETRSEFVVPDAAQEKILKVTGDELKAALATSKRLLEGVKANHPESPWSRRAEYELKRSFGITFRSYYQPPPRPNPNAKPRPKPTPPPKL